MLKLSCMVPCAAVVVSVSLGACSDDTVLPPTPATITMSGATTVSPGVESDTVIALVSSADSRPVPGVALTWTIDDPTADLIVVDATTNAAGRARAVVRGGTVLYGQDITVSAANLPTARRLLTMTTGRPRGPIMGSTANQPFCDVAADGRLLCEGNGAPEQILAGPVTAVVNAGDQPCALLSNGRVACHFSGETAWREIPGTHPPLVSIALSAEGTVAPGTCGLDADGQAWCWGPSGPRFLQPTGSPAWTTVQPLPTALRFRQLSVSGDNICGVLLGDDEVWCWGNSEGGILGTAVAAAGEPRQIADLPPSTSVHLANFAAACAHGTDRLVRCWGNPFNDGLGRGLPSNAGPMPTPQPISGVGVALSVGSVGNGFAVVDTNGRLYLWGRIPSSTSPNQPVPIRFAPAATFMAVRTARGLACGSISDGRGVCFPTGQAIQHAVFEGNTESFRLHTAVPNW
jgi:hypothetical protein